MGCSRELHLSDCACLVEHEPSLVVGGVVDEGTGARRQVACSRSASFLKAINSDQADCTGASGLSADGEDVRSCVPVENGPFVVGGWGQSDWRGNKLSGRGISPFWDHCYRFQRGE